MAKTKIFVASAGTGKTTTLMTLLGECLEKTSPKKIGFTTFTKAGAQEAIDRALKQYTNYELNDFQAFSTLHALCYRRIPNKRIINWQDYKTLSGLTGLRLSGGTTVSKKDGTTFSSGSGDRMLYYNGLMRNMQVSAKQILLDNPSTTISVQDLEMFSKFYKEFKQTNDLYDFTDQLEQFVELDVQIDLDYLFVDEAQDLSPLQWKVIDQLSRTVKQVYIAGDDKQSIYKFSGGDPVSLIERKGERVVLDTSYRLPAKILEYSEKIAAKISQKQEYTINTIKEAGGVTKIKGLNELDFSNGTWLLLCRNRAFLPYFENLLIKRRQLFVSGGDCSLFNPNTVPMILLWEQLRKGFKVYAKDLKILYREYLPTGTAVARGSKKLMDSMPDLEMFDKHELSTNYGLRTTAPWDKVFKLSDTTRDILKKAEETGGLEKSGNVEINTIHAVKGREADNVVVLPDMVEITSKSFAQDPDNEHRVFYVAVTRAMKHLYVHHPVTSRFYEMP
jgi:superfamily I DNA/RNA helicase